MMGSKHKNSNKEIDLDEKASEIIKNSPPYIEDEPATVGSPGNLIENDEEKENGNKKNKQRS